ncbi:NAD(P)-dependent oxidoreductase [Photobacterium sanctipauli]|uniref:NAD(P)-dependent oxidoreductase n=1 Tax=Photobacterium sanctipauli TaxID=1342794 RepID=A0A2T3P132_9GAMM|nr:NAD(P)-dependent oxidoreductase [Photobacterium sanctipauli]PSW22224.1 NAD(P)-dependent oxidoreductase [Photobacterium sanctipauli]
MAKVSRLAFIGFGEAAKAFLTGWADAAPPVITAYDQKTNHLSLRKDKLQDYIQQDVQGCFNLHEAIDSAKVVFSLVTADQAYEAAAAAAKHIKPGQFYFDCNSCSPDTKRENAKLINAAGGCYVDVAVMSPVHPKLHRTPLLICGSHAEQAKPLFDSLGMNAQIIEGDVGVASSIKMVRSIMVKGLEALTAECLLAARKAQIDTRILASLDNSYPEFNWYEKAGYNLERMMLHGVRRAAEMREVALTVEQLGLNNGMAKATTDWQQQIGDLALNAESEDFAELADALLNELEAQQAVTAAPIADKKIV